MTMTKDELKMLSEGDPKPDVEREAMAVVFFFVMALCAILVCALAMGMLYGVYELVMLLIA